LGALCNGLGFGDDRSGRDGDVLFIEGKYPARRRGGKIYRAPLASWRENHARRHRVAGKYPSRRGGKISRAASFDGNLPRARLGGNLSRAKHAKKMAGKYKKERKMGSFAPVGGSNRCKRVFCTGSSHEPVQKGRSITAPRAPSSPFRVRSFS
jgi:hypothetical protein